MTLFGLPGWSIRRGRGFGGTALIRGGCGYALLSRFSLHTVERVFAGGQGKEEREHKGAFKRFHRNILPNYVLDSGVPRAGLEEEPGAGGRILSAMQVKVAS